MASKSFLKIVLLAVFISSLTAVSALALKDEVVEDEIISHVLDTTKMVRVEWEPITPIYIEPQIYRLLLGPNDYMIWDDHGGWWYDAEKTVDNWDDDLMCWAAACSNALEWTGWGIVTDPATGDLTETELMFDNYLHYWVDRGGWMSYGWSWWYDGEDPDPGEGRLDITDSGGGYWPDWVFDDYYHEEWDRDEVLPRIDEYLHAGYSVTLGIRPVGGMGGHAITCWGYRYNPLGFSERHEHPENYYMGVYVTDSDDDKHHAEAAPPPNTLRYYNVTYDDTNDRWVLDYGSGSGWYVDAIMALAPPDPEDFGSRPAALFEAVTGTVGFPVTIDGSLSTDPDGDPLQYRWDFDEDGFWDTGWSPSPTVTNTWDDEYRGYVLLEVSDGVFKDVHKASAQVTYPVLDVAFVWDLRPSLMGYEIMLTDKSLVNFEDVVEWVWDFGGKETSTERNPLISIKDEGMYDVKLTLRFKDGTTRTYTKDIQVSDVTASFNWYPEPQIEGSPIQFKDNSTSLSTKMRSWVWDFGDGTASKERSPSHTYDDDGSYDVSLTVTNDDGSTNTLTQKVTVLDLSPSAAFTYGPRPPIQSEPVEFVDLSVSSPDPIVSWRWDFGDGATSSKQNPVHTYAKEGSYKVRLTVTDEDGSVDSIGYVLQIVKPPSRETPSLMYSHGDPTDAEQLILELINRARADPYAEGKRLGVDITEGVKGEVAPRPPLSLNARLSKAARAHSWDMRMHGFSQTDSEGLYYPDRMKNAGYLGTPIGEHIARGGSPERLYEILMLEENPVPGLSHREVLLGIGYDHNEVGIGYLPASGGYDDFLTTEYGYSPDQAFIVGVVYMDLDADGFYDPGEGLDGVTIMPSSGSYYAVTSESGGYAIPITSQGLLMVTASGGGLKTPIAMTVETQIPGDNVKLDFILQSEPESAQDLEIRVVGEGKTSPSPDEVHSYEWGSVILLSASPAEGWRFNRWEIDDRSYEENPLRITLDGDVLVTAFFGESERQLYKLVIGVEGSGSTEPAPGSIEVEEGEKVTMKALPEDGWLFDGWVLDGEPVGGDSTIELDVDRDREIVAVFVEEQPKEGGGSNPLTSILNALMDLIQSLMRLFG